MTPLRSSSFRGATIARRSVRPAAVALLLAATVLRFWDLEGPSLWYDEAYTWWVSTQVSRTDALISSLREVIPPLSYFGWRAWASATGTTEFALRAASALAGVLAVAALGAVARRLARSPAALLAGLALAAIAPPLVWASRELRMYGPLLAFVALGDFALVEVLLGPTRHRRLWAWAWGAAAIAALYTVALAGFWLIGQGCFALLALVIGQAADIQRAADVRRGVPCQQGVPCRQGMVRALLPPALATALAFLPWLLPALPHLDANRGYWPGTLPVTEFLSRTVRGITFFDAVAPEATALRLGVVIVAVAALAPVLLRPRRPGSYFALVTTLPPLLLAAAVFYSVPKWNLQHTVVFAPGVVLGLAVAAASPFVSPSGGGKTEPRGWGAAAITIAAAALFALATGRLLTDPALAHDDWRSLVAYVRDNRAEGEVVIIETGAAKQAWIYYGGAEGLLPLPDDPLLDVTHTLHYANTAPALAAALARAPGVWVVGWLADVTDPTGIVETLLEDIGEPTSIPVFHGLTLRHYTLTRPPEFGDAPAVTTQPDAELLPGVRLWGATLPTTPQPADSPIAIRTWWTVSNPALHTGRCYLASVRIYDRFGNQWGTVDGPAAAGDLRAEHWPADTLVLGRYDAQLLPGAPSGAYTVTLMLYELGADVPSAGTTLGSIIVSRPSTIPTPEGTFEPVTTVLQPSAGESLDLLGVLLQTDSVKPCETLQGWLFWEVKSPLATPDAVRITLGDSTITLEAADILPAQWEPGDRFLTLFRLPIGCRALRANVPVIVSLLQGEPAEPTEVTAWAGPEVAIVVERAFESPEGLTSTTLTVGDGMAELLGYTLEPEHIGDGKPFRLVLVWRAGTITDVPYSVFVHVTPSGRPGPLAAQHDAWPAMGGRPTYTWVPGEIVTDPHDLPGLPPGDYDIRIGVYGPDVVRLPLTQRGTPVVDDVLVLTSLTVE